MRMNMRATFTLLATILGIAGQAKADAPEYVRVGNISSYGGNGCKQGTIGKLVSSDRQSFTLIFDDFIAEAGPNVALEAARKNCQITVDIEFPQGWTYSIAGFDYRGYADLQSNKVEAAIRSNYYFQGSNLDNTLETKFKGPMSMEDYLIHDQFGVDAISWSPCGDSKPLNISTTVSVDNSKKRSHSGAVGVDSLDASFTQVFHLQWQRCGGGSGGGSTGTYPTDPLLDTPSYVKINSMTYGGSGCPANGVGKLMSQDRTSLTLIYDSFLAEIGPDIARSKSRAFCQVGVELEYPQGWTFSVMTLDTRGYADLDPSVTGKTSTSYYFQSMTNDIAFTTTLKGVRDEYKIRDSLAIDAVWAPCKEADRKPLNIKTSVALSSTDRNARGLLQIDSTDLSLYYVYGLRWKRCD